MVHTHVLGKVHKLYCSPGVVFGGIADHGHTFEIGEGGEKVGHHRADSCRHLGRGLSEDLLADSVDVELRQYWGRIKAVDCGAEVAHDVSP